MGHPIHGPDFFFLLRAWRASPTQQLHTMNASFPRRRESTFKPLALPKNQYSDLVERLAPQIATVKEDLRAGRLPSDITNALRASGLLNIHLMVICLQATGASIAELKAFDRWWGPQGVTDASAFNAWAAHVFKS